MSTESTQPVDGNGDPLAHLTKDPDDVTNARYERAELTSREYWCTECQLRVTLSTDHQVEYGHGRHCTHKISHDGGES